MANFAEIVEIVASDSAAQGSRVDVTVRVKNIWHSWFRIYCVAVVDSLRFIDWLNEVVGPGDIEEFSGAFTMGGEDMRILAQTWYESGGNLYKDDEKTKDISVVTDDLVDAFEKLEITSYGRA